MKELLATKQLIDAPTRGLKGDISIHKAERTGLESARRPPSKCIKKGVIRIGRVDQKEERQSEGPSSS